MLKSLRPYTSEKQVGEGFSPIQFAYFLLFVGIILFQLNLFKPLIVNMFRMAGFVAKPKITEVKTVTVIDSIFVKPTPKIEVTSSLDTIIIAKSTELITATIRIGMDPIKKTEIIAILETPTAIYVEPTIVKTFEFLPVITPLGSPPADVSDDGQERNKNKREKIWFSVEDCKSICGYEIPVMCYNRNDEYFCSVPGMTFDGQPLE